MNPWGLTEKGFYRPSYAELLVAYETQAKEKFGGQINLSSRSPLGLFLRIFAWFSGMGWQLAEDVYNSGFVDTAAGISLARLGAFIGIRPLAAQKAVGQLNIIGDPGGAVPAGFLVASSSQRYVVVESVIIGNDGRAVATIRAYNAGPDGNADTGVITQIVTPLAHVIEVVNPGPLTGGRDKETDAEFRARYYTSTDIAGGSNIDAVRAELLQTDAVAAAAVFENDSDDPTPEGMPPHSIECIVYGGLDTTVAQAVHRRKPAGIQAVGNTTVTVIDASGISREISFSRPTPRPIWAQITNLVTDDSFGPNGPTNIAAALIGVIGSEATDMVGGLNIGETVIYNRLIGPVNSVPGVIDFQLEISSNGTDWSRNNIAVELREKAVTSADKVVIL